MKRHFLLFALLLALALAIAAVGYTQTRQQRTAASIAGVWKGNFPGAPAVELNLQPQASKLAGTVIFYRVVNSGNGAEIKGKVEAPLIAPEFDGQQLAFQVQREDGTYYQGKVQFTDDHEAVLRSENQATGDEAEVILRRER